jgi:hypothetical protein
MTAVKEPRITPFTHRPRGGEERQLDGDDDRDGRTRQVERVDVADTRASHAATVAATPMVMTTPRAMGLDTALATYIRRVKWTEIPRCAGSARSRVRPARSHLEGYRNHRSGRNAALIAHFGFLSVFP